jgi:hypothetical protein
MIADDDDLDIESDGKVLGTARYIAPEVLTTGRASLKSDIYSLGVMAYQIFAGRVPFDGASREEILAAHVHRRFTPLHRAAPGLRQEVSDLVAAMISQEPNDRPDTGAVVRDFERLSRKQKTGAPLVVHNDPTSTFFQKDGPKDPRHVSRRLLWIGAAMAVLFVLVAALWFVFRERDHSKLKEELPPTIKAATPTDPNTNEILLGRPLAALQVPPITSFRDATARDEFRRIAALGDTAWSHRDASAALVHWREAREKLWKLDTTLESRIRHAGLEVAQTRARLEKQQGNREAQLDALEEAAFFDPDAVAEELRLLREGLQTAPPPEGTVRLRSKNVFHARRTLVTHQEYFDWLLRTKGKASMPPGWMRGRFPVGAANDPVVLLSEEDARKFAAARQERLPSEAELKRIRALSGLPHEGEVNTAGLFAHGFRTVRD